MYTEPNVCGGIEATQLPYHVNIFDAEVQPENGIEYQVFTSFFGNKYRLLIYIYII
jgi:hypothetical protein